MLVDPKPKVGYRSVKQSEWTAAQNKIFAKIMVNNFQNLAEAFRKISQKTGKSFDACSSYWYNLKNTGRLKQFFKIYYDENFEMCFMTVGKNKKLINGKITTKRTKPQKHTSSIWQKILNLFK